MCNRDEGGKPGPVGEKASRKQVLSVSWNGQGSWARVLMWHKGEEGDRLAGGAAEGMGWDQSQETAALAPYGMASQTRSTSGVLAAE